MSLDLSKEKVAQHYRIGVAGSFTDSLIEVQAASPTSASSDIYVRWVPRTKGSYLGPIGNINSSYIANTGSGEGAGHGYLKWTPGYSPYTVLHLLRWTMVDTATATAQGGVPGLDIQGIDSYTSYYTGNAADDLAGRLEDIHNGLYGNNVVYAIVSQNQTHSSAALYTAMNNQHSWRWSRVLRGTTGLTNYSYCAVGTNINSLGLLSESLQGAGSGHINASTEIYIEHDTDKIGHAGFGEELSSGMGAGTREYTNPAGTSTVMHTVNWDQSNDQYHLDPGQKIRITGMADVSQYSAAYGGSAYVDIVDSATGNTRVVETQGTGLHKFEATYEKPPGSTSIQIRAALATGSGTGNGVANTGVSMSNLEVFKCGHNPDQDRDVAVTGTGLNALNVQEGIAGFDLGKPDEFKTFWNSDRNLLSNRTSTFALDQSGSETGPGLAFRAMSYLYHNSSTYGYGMTPDYNHNNWVRWFNDDFTTTSDKVGVKEVLYAPSNSTTYVEFDDSRFSGSGGVEIDPTKLYMFGVWTRVRYNTDTGTPQAPNSIATIASTYSVGNTPQALKTYTGVQSFDPNYFECERVENSTYSTEANKWRLMSNFYLPYDWTSTQVTDWYNNHYGSWAGEYHWGGGGSALYPNTTYGLAASSVVNGRVAQFGNAFCKYIRPKLKVEVYSSKTLWFEYAYPFVVEIDPLNISTGGNAFFWDVREY